jgi:hypothetical protein
MFHTPAHKQGRDDSPMVHPVRPTERIPVPIVIEHTLSDYYIRKGYIQHAVQLKREYAAQRVAQPA